MSKMDRMKDRHLNILLFYSFSSRNFCTDTKVDRSKLVDPYVPITEFQQLI